jgi:hypothetical protein
VHWKIVLSSMMTLLSALLYTETFGERWLGSKTKHLPPESERKESTVKWFQFQIGPPLSVNSLSVLFSLMFTKLRMSTIAKDNVYGLTALWQSKVQAEIVIDYTRETAEVFANAVKIGLKVEYDRFIHLTIADLWTSFDGFDRPRQASATEGLPSWCPDFQHPKDSPHRVRHRSLSLAVKNRIKAFARYEHTPGFETIAIQVLKLDTITKRMEAACPGASQQTDEPYSALTAWPQKISGDLPSGYQVNRGLRRDLQTFFYEDAEHTPNFTFDHFSKSLERLLCVLPWQFEDILQDVVVRRTLDKLSLQFGRFVFLTESGRTGYSARPPCLGGHIVLVPGRDPTSAMQMLTADCTQYAGCATVLGLMGDSLLESLDDMETKWEMVVLR